MRTRIVALVVALTLGGAVAAVQPVIAKPAIHPAVAVTAKKCSSGYKHAVMPNGSHKCLRAGQFCSRKRSWQRVYKRKGYYCPPSRHLRRR